MTGLSLRSAKRFKISVVPERISVPFYRLSGNDLVMKLCPKLSFRCLPLSYSVFLKVCECIDLQLVYSNYLFPAFLTYFFFKKNEISVIPNPASCILSLNEPKKRSIKLVESS